MQQDVFMVYAEMSIQIKGTSFGAAMHEWVFISRSAFGKLQLSHT